MKVALVPGRPVECRFIEHVVAPTIWARSVLMKVALVPGRPQGSPLLYGRGVY